MSEALEALKRMEYFVNEEMGIKTFKQSGWHIEGTDDYELIKEALQRLEAIDNAKPSEALECLEETKKIIHNYISNGDWDNKILPKLDIVKQALIKSQEQEKVLKIIKEKEVNMQVFNQCEDVEVYNNVYKKQKDRQLTEKEFELLKRCFR